MAHMCLSMVTMSISRGRVSRSGTADRRFPSDLFTSKMIRLFTDPSAFSLSKRASRDAISLPKVSSIHCHEHLFAKPFEMHLHVGLLGLLAHGHIVAQRLELRKLPRFAFKFTVRIQGWRKYSIAWTGSPWLFSEGPLLLQILLSRHPGPWTSFATRPIGSRPGGS